MAGKYIGFGKLKSELAGKPGVRDAGALAAYEGRRKYGAKRFDKAAASGTSLKGAKPKITEDDPRWNPKTMGNKRGSKNSRNASDGHGQYRPT